jgi:hypothetical protein
MGFLDANRGLSFSEWLDLRKKVSKSMTSEPMRDPLTDPLLTPANSALVVIDYQPSQIQTVTSMDTEPLVRNIVSVSRTAKTYGLPIVLSTVNVANEPIAALSDHRDPPGGDMDAGHRWRPGPSAIAGSQAASTTN